MAKKHLFTDSVTSETFYVNEHQLSRINKLGTISDESRRCGCSSGALKIGDIVTVSPSNKAFAIRKFVKCDILASKLVSIVFKTTVGSTVKVNVNTPYSVSCGNCGGKKL